MGIKSSGVLGESSVLSASQWNIWFNRDGSPLCFKVGWGLLPRFCIDPNCSVFPPCEPYVCYFLLLINCLIFLRAFCVPLGSLLLDMILVGWEKHMVFFTLVAVFVIPSEYRQIHCTLKFFHEQGQPLYTDLLPYFSRKEIYALIYYLCSDSV